MRTNTYVIAAAVLLVFACIGLGWWIYELRGQLGTAVAGEAETRGQLEQLEQRLVDLDQSLESQRGQAANLAGELDSTRTRVKKLEAEKMAAERQQQTLEQQMTQALAEQEVTISRLKGKLMVNILDRVMFDSGKAVLKPQGQELLLKVAEVLKTVPDRQVMIVGHTDNVPVTASRHLFATNWELSAARATAAVRFLSETAGVDPAMLGALGYGEFHPIADNSTPEGRAENRRIEVLILDSDVLDLGGK